MLTCIDGFWCRRASPDPLPGEAITILSSNVFVPGKLTLVVQCELPEGMWLRVASIIHTCAAIVFGAFVPPYPYTLYADMSLGASCSVESARGTRSLVDGESGSRVWATSKRCHMKSGNGSWDRSTTRLRLVRCSNSKSVPLLSLPGLQVGRLGNC